MNHRLNPSKQYGACIWTNKCKTPKLSTRQEGTSSASVTSNGQYTFSNRAPYLLPFYTCHAHAPISTHHTYLPKIQRTCALCCAHASSHSRELIILALASRRPTVELLHRHCNARARRVRDAHPLSSSTKGRLLKRDSEQRALAPTASIFPTSRQFARRIGDVIRERAALGRSNRHKRV